nr:AI-2E family transporter [Lachnospiraceae bacterium]
KVVYAFMSSPERANQLINNARFTNRTFGGFITGKLFDSLIIGIITFIALSIMRMPYTLLISCIIGVTNVIPFFGPFLGAIPSAFIILLISPMKCLVFIIYVIILQQFDGNILGPKILGDSTGLPSFWVIFAITLFGGIFGVVGMFIGVPIFSVIYAAFRANLESRLKRKKMPSDTEFYINSDYYPAEISVTDKLTSLSGEHLILKDGTVSERIQDNRSRVKTRPRKEKNNGSASKQTPES